MSRGLPRVDMRHDADIAECERVGICRTMVSRCVGARLRRVNRQGLTSRWKPVQVSWVSRDSGSELVWTTRGNWKDGSEFPRAAPSTTSCAPRLFWAASGYCVLPKRRYGY